MIEWDGYDNDNQPNNNEYYHGCQNCHNPMIKCDLCEQPYCPNCFNNKHLIQYCSYCNQPQYCVKINQIVHFKCYICYYSHKKTEEGKK